MYINVRLSRFVQKIIVTCFFMLFGILISGMVISTAGQSESQNVKVPIIMYHSLLKDTKMHNGYIISPDRLEEDLKFIEENGFTTITAGDLIDYVYNKKTLPAKPVMLTFDDGHYNNYTYAYELLKEYNAKAVISPIVYQSEIYQNQKLNSPVWGYVTLDNLAEMQKSGVFEVANHSYNMHDKKGRVGVAKKYGEMEEEYKKKISDDILKAQEILDNHIGYSPQCFTYPFGEKSDLTEKIIKELGFKVTLSCVEKLNVITQSKESLFSLGRYLRKNNESSEHLFARIGVYYPEAKG